MLFPELREVPAAPVETDGWERLSAPGDKIRGHWLHESGWEITHCGHPTANFPYSLVDPAHPGCLTVTHNGHGFRTIAIAKEAVRSVLRGGSYTTDTNCVPGTRVVEVAHG